jgi:hypothetical protein
MTKRLQNARLILISLDKDQAGGKVSWEWWSKYFRNAKRWPTIEGKDPCEAFQNGLDIKKKIMDHRRTSLQAASRSSKNLSVRPLQ